MMNVKLVVIGGVTGGASTAARLRRLDESAEIIMLERGEHVSFSNCCLPYHLSGTVADSDSLILMDPKRFKAQHNIEARVNHEAVSIDRAKKEVVVRETKTGRTYRESYDKLMLAPGLDPTPPENVPGLDRENVFMIQNVTDIRALKACADRPGVEDAVVVGGGFIALEAAENLREAGKKVHLIVRRDQIAKNFDYDMVQILHKELLDNGVDLRLRSQVAAIEADRVLVKTGDKTEAVPAGLVVMATGGRPNTRLAAEAGLEIGETGGIRVNHNYQTSDPDIYAVGDVIESFNRLTRRPGRLALAGPAQRQARAAANHMCGIPNSNRGFIGSSCIRLFGQNAAGTGLGEREAKAAGIPFDSVTVYPPDKVGLMPDSHYMAFKLLFEVPTGRVLGAQAVGRGAVDKRIDVIAAMISMGGTLEDLQELELCYAPVFGTPKDVVNQAALVALNVLNGAAKQVHVTEVRRLVEEGAYIVDVRNPGEFEAGHLKGAHNVPLPQLRDRLDEIPRDIPVYLHCRSSQRSYYALRILRGHGFDNVTNISGSFLGICLYEYFNDVDGKREPIVDHYNFN